MQQSTILIESRPEMSNFLHGTFAVVFYVSLGKLCSIDIRYNLLCFLGRLLVLIIISSMLLFINHACKRTHVLKNKACICKTVHNSAIQLANCTQKGCLDSHASYSIGLMTTGTYE